MTVDQVMKLLAPLRNRVANVLARAVVQLVNDLPKLQLVQLGVLEGETREGCERFQQYGMTSVPHAGAEAVVLFVGGRRDHGLVVAVDDRRYRMKGLQPGEVALYTDEGDYVLLKRGRIVEVKAGTKLRVDAPLAEFTGSLTIAGALQVTGNVTAANVSASGAVADAAGNMAALRTAYNAHTHIEHGTGGGTTGTPSTGM